MNTNGSIPFTNPLKLQDNVTTILDLPQIELTPILEEEYNEMASLDTFGF